jgi:hypothetical protein
MAMARVGRRLAVVRVGAVLAALAAVAALSLPGAGAAVVRALGATAAPATTKIGDTTCVSSGESTTCTGTYGGDKAWDPWSDTQISQEPTVTVSQTGNLVDQVVHVSWQYLTPSLSEEKAPNPPAAFFYADDVYQCQGTDPSSIANCYNPSAADVQEGPRNATTGVTSALDATGPVGGKAASGGNPSDWIGQADIHVEAGTEENSFLGCDIHTPCSLVIDPWWGGEPTNCENHSEDFILPTHQIGYARTTPPACSWADRIVVPLSFNPTPGNCPDKAPQFYAQGSPMLERAMNQWIPGWCTGPAPLSFSYSFRTTEQQARDNFLSGGQAVTAPTDMALVTLPPDAAATQASSRKFTYAPLANSAVAVAYLVDDPANSQPVTHLALDARLLTKLLTQSYSLEYNCAPELAAGEPPASSEDCDPAVSGNRQTLYDDPEFLALNTACQPQLDRTTPCGRGDFPADGSSGGVTLLGGFLPTVQADESDMTFETTDWIASTPDALQFLDGQPDPNGMRVNTNYWDQAYPIQAFTELDPGWTHPAPVYQGDFAGSMQLTWNPVEGLDNIAADLVTYAPTVLDPYWACVLPQGPQSCTPSTAATGYGFQTWVQAEGLESPGSRDLISVLDEGDAAAYDFPAAALVNAAGQAVTPTTASVEDAVKDMSTNPDGITQYSDFASTDPGAYPLTMVDYAMVPTCGLPAAKASAIARFLTDVATTGQTPGVAPGDLAPGYAPLNSAQREQTLKAATEVKDQTCKSAPPDTTVSGRPGVNDVTPAKTPGGSPGRTGQPEQRALGKARSELSPNGSTRMRGAQTAAYGVKSPLSGLGATWIALALILGVLLLLGGPAVFVLVATGKWPAVLGWLRAALARLRAAPRQLAGLARRA